MIEIDGAIGYGQVLRSAIALSALTLNPIKIINIRKGRPKPGLMAQHLTGVKIAGEFCNAEIKGLTLGSTQVEFYPKSFNLSDRKIDIGTAGSIGLLLQTLTPLVVFGDKLTTLEIIGGTAGLGAPTIQFLKNVTYQIISKLGAKLPEIKIIKEGFYPRGRGKIKIKFEPIKKLNSIKLTERGKVRSIKGVSIAGKLPKHIADRQANTAKKILLDHGFDQVEIESQVVDTFSPGTSITLFAECENSILGSDNIGKRGVPAEKIAEQASLDLINSIESKAALDKYMADQVLPFLALADSESKITVEKITQHCLTNINVCEKILGVKFEVKEKEILIDGIGFQNKFL